MVEQALTVLAVFGIVGAVIILSALFFALLCLIVEKF